MPEWVLRRCTGGETLDILDALADIYIQGYATDQDAGRSLYTREAFLERTARQTKSPGFTLIAGYADAELAGFSFGLPFLPGRWWQGETDTPPPHPNDGPKFAVIELVVNPRFQGQGLAGHLMRALLQDRPEPYATLLADKHGRARDMYDRWGWRTVQSLLPAPDVEELDVLVKEL